MRCPTTGEQSGRSRATNLIPSSESRSSLRSSSTGTSATKDTGGAQQHFDVFYGDADDILEPAMPAKVADQLPHATPHICEGAGHYGFIDAERWTQFVSAVART
ncbi:MAG: hypothetical protein M9886_08235 [Candidatus Nanopelagicales bacterium]|nr:hypothetical protein [Candidatus Nanopelagicales bacterium]